MIKEVQEIFENIELDSAWSIKLIRIHSTMREGLVYSAREITFDPVNTLKRHINELKNKYIMGEVPLLKKFISLCEYDGTAEETNIYTMLVDDNMISEAYEKLINTIINADVEGDPFDIKPNASVIAGISKGQPVYFFSLQSPFVNMRRKHIWDKSKFIEINKPVLALKLTTDVIIYNGVVYFLSMAGEKLFNMERAYKAVCSCCVDYIENSKIITNIESFRQTAFSGNNPRRFVSYNKYYLEQLKNKKIREKIGKKFNIPLKNGIFDSDENGTSEKIVKILCGKGMVEPFDDNPVEVSSSRVWR